MRLVLPWCVLVVSACLPSCSESAAATVPGDGTLILEVGGQQGSLREALAAAGVTMAPAQRVRDLEVRQESVPVLDGAGQDPKQPPEPVVDPDQVPLPTPTEPQFKTVSLKRGQTLIHLAKEHLGNGNRFRELLECNGWTETQARRLPEGAQVKVPVDRPVDKAVEAGGRGRPR